MSYQVKEVFYSLQGEGARTGRPAVFCRFAGCNLWNGKEEQRPKSICRFCDTDFVGTDGIGGGKFKTASELASYLNDFWPKKQQNTIDESNHKIKKYIVFTGGEPALQLDDELIIALKQYDFEIAIETNGTLDLPQGIDWICVSPKGISDVVIQKGHELKLVYPQSDLSPESVENWNFQHFYLQPLDITFDKKYQEQKNIYQKTIEYCLNNPQWHMSLQTHKILDIR